MAIEARTKSYLTHNAIYNCTCDITSSAKKEISVQY